MLDTVVALFFRSMADDHLLTRLEVVAVRLLGCETAVTLAGKRTLRLLARTLGMPVFGAIKPLMKSHYSKLGFDPRSPVFLSRHPNWSLGRIDGETRCAFWADEPVDHGFDPKQLITVDLARTPSAESFRARNCHSTT